MDGSGQIDVALYRDALKIACEISVTTGSDQELRNVEKCFAAGFGHVIVISDEPRHLATLRKSIGPELDEAFAEKVSYCAGSDLPSVLRNLAPPVQEQTVRGYRVRTKRVESDSTAATMKRKAVVDVIARSLASRIDDPAKTDKT